jgi:SET domain-containing protein
VKVIDKALERDFVRVGKSRIAGVGLFAKRNIPRGARIIEYKGRRRSAAEAILSPDDEAPGRVYSFRVDDKTVIDATTRGNEARFINHSCQPNCEAYVFSGKVFIYAMRKIRRHEELTFDYQLRTPSGFVADDPARYICLCGAERCRGTMLGSPGADE